MRLSLITAASTLATVLSGVCAEETGVITTIVPIDKLRFPVKRNKRGTRNLTGDHCSTECYGVAGGGPNEADCSVIVSDLWASGGNFISVLPGTSYNKVYRSCVVMFFNPTDDTIQYDYSYMGTVADWLRQACNAAHNYSAGWCWFDQSGYDKETLGDYPGILLEHA